MDKALPRNVAVVFALQLVCCTTDTLPPELLQGASSCVDTDAGKSATDAGKTRTDAGKAMDAGKANTDASKANTDASKTNRDARSAIDPAGDTDPEEPAPEQPELPAPVEEDPGQAGACSVGYTTVAAKCVCDLNGTFAFRGQVDTEISDQNGIEDARDISELWAIARHTYDADGKLLLSITECGQAIPDLCGTGLPPLVGIEAYAQYAPAKAWRERGSSPGTTIEMQLPEALPSMPFVSPEFALLGGISLEDPLGAWPGKRTEVQGGSDFGGSAVNDARWVDDDNDGAIGVTTFAVPPGGVAAESSASAPLASYGARSAKCPRGDPKASRNPYAYLPVPEGLSLRRVKQLHQATRLITALQGQLESCDRISGDLTGPNDGRVQLDTRVGGCAIVSGSNEAACGASLLDLVEGSKSLGSGSIGPSATFVMKRVADEITCAEVHATQFD